MFQQMDLPKGNEHIYELPSLDPRQSELQDNERPIGDLFVRNWWKMNSRISE